MAFKRSLDVDKGTYPVNQFFSDFFKNMFDNMADKKLVKEEAARRL